MEFLKTRQIDTILGVDASTHSFAFCKFGQNGPELWGEITFNGSNVFERLSDGQKKVRAIRDTLKSDLIVFESAIYVQNKKTVILLAYAFGALISALMSDGTKVEEIAPMTWQAAIKNKALTKDEKEAVRKEFPDKKDSWYKARHREIRKQKTMTWVQKTYGITVDSNNVADAIAVASVGHDLFASLDVPEKT